MGRDRALSLIQPTGKGQLHIGNYFGAIRNWVKLQEHYDCIFGAVDYHAITVDFDPKTLPRQSMDIITDLIACGIDPQRSTVMIQSHVPEHTELCWIFNCVAAYGDVQRMTQFKDKAEEQAYVTVGLFDYPVLQAADILIYKAKAVPVGQDQDQHLELTRGIAQKFNTRFGEVFPIPYTGAKLRHMHDLRGAKIVSPADPEKKMSKSLGDKHCIFVMEEEKAIRKKIRSAVTDMGPADVSGDKSPGVANLFHLLELTAPPSVVDEFESAYRAETLKYVELKDAVFEHLMEELRPVRERKRELESDPETIRTIIREGSEKARQMARETLSEVRKLLGVGPI
ncbi:MAG TPA: tryptophan--tRNA ligase [Acidobacteriota bacterium]|nr:tryptophan--tRNA ligase [Acidobacteriota bacterium]